MKQKTIAVCLITNNDYLSTRYVIENLMQKTALKFRLQIVDNGSKEEDLKEYLRWLTTETKGYLKELPDPKPLAECYNFLLQTVNQEVCVFFPVNILVNDYWLEDLLTGINSIDNSGIIGIRPTSTPIKFAPLLHHSFTKSDDYLENTIAFPDRVNTVVCFKKNRVETIGTFDINLDSAGYELSEFCFRIKANGYNNCFIRKQSCFQIPVKNEVLFPPLTPDKFQKFKIAVETMFKVRQFVKKQ